MSGASDWDQKVVLVTGGAGFLGSHVVDALVLRGARVRVLDNLSRGFLEFVNRDPRVQLIRGDLLESVALEQACQGVDFVFHLAANADVKDGLLHPRKDTEQNLLATLNLLEAMRRHGVKEIAFSSTGAVYGDAEPLPSAETAPFPVQTSLYGASKVAAEGLLSAYAYGYAFNVWILRLVSLLGPRYTHGHVFDFWRKLKACPERIEVLGNGRQQKSYLHVLDCVEAFFCATEQARQPVNIFNVGSNEMLEVNESLGIICKELGVSPAVHYTGGDRGWVGDAPRLMLDASRLRALGWLPQRDLRAAVIETLHFLQQNPDCTRAA